MAKEKEINGKMCRYYVAGYIWVPADGSSATTHIDGKDVSLKIIRDNTGVWAEHPWGHRISMAEAVATCFCAPKPNDGKTYILTHRDGDITNVYKRNLIWEKYRYKHAVSDTVKLKLYDSAVVVRNDGTILVDGHVCEPCCSMYDSDTDLEVVIHPYIPVKEKGSIAYKKLSIDDIMNRGGFVQGDDGDLANPEILHQDGDWLNFSSDNLLWVERDDPRYKSFCTRRIDDMNQLMEELNAKQGKKVPDFMLKKVAS